MSLLATRANALRQIPLKQLSVLKYVAIKPLPDYYNSTLIREIEIP
jgi:hypothetical protein